MANLTATLPTHPSRKNKILAAIGVVVIGHAGILFALSNMQPSQLKPIIPPKPIQVRIIELQKPKSEPPKPVEPPKPKQVEIKDTPPPPPKKVEKVEQVKKPAEKPKAVEPPKPTKVETPKPIATPVVTEVVQKPIVVEKPTVVETPKADPTPPQPAKPAVDMTPRDLGTGANVNWAKNREPKPKINIVDLDKVTNGTVILRIDVDENGKIKARVVQSSGNPKVDREMVRAVQAARFQPYKENGVAVPFFAEQPFRVK